MTIFRGKLFLLSSLLFLGMLIPGNAWSATPTETSTVTPTETPTASETCTFTETPSITETPTVTQTWTTTPTASPTASVSATLTITQTFTYTPTSTVTPVRRTAWLEHFYGEPGTKPSAWEDNTDNLGHNAQFLYSTTPSIATLKCTDPADVWGKTISLIKTIDVSQYPLLKVRVTGVSGGPKDKWGIVMRIDGNNDYLVVQAPTDYVGERIYAYSANFLAKFNLDPENATQKIRLELSVEGPKGATIDFDFVEFYNEFYEPPAQPLNSLNINGSQPARSVDLCISNNKVCVAWREEIIPGILSRNLVGYYDAQSNTINVFGMFDGRYGELNVAADGQYVYLCWVQYRNGKNSLAFTKRYDGQAWEDMGGNWESDDGLDITTWKGQPVIAWPLWCTVTEQRLVYANLFDGTQWSNVGGPLNQVTKDKGFEYPSPQIKTFENAMYITWFDQWETTQTGADAISRVSIRKYQNNEWSPLGPDFLKCREPKLAINKKGDLFVAWKQYIPDLNKWNIFARRWLKKTQQWQQFEGGAINEDAPELFDLATISNIPIIVLVEKGNILVKYWDGKGWVTTATSPLNPNDISADIKNLKILVRDKTVNVAWTGQGENGIQQLYMKEFLLDVPDVLGEPEMRVKTFALPNPFLPRAVAKTVFYYRNSSQGNDCTLRIMTVRGRVLRTLKNQLEWDGRDEQGQLCEGGLYIYQIEYQGDRASGTVVVIR